MDALARLTVWALEVEPLLRRDLAINLYTTEDLALLAKLKQVVFELAIGGALDHDELVIYDALIDRIEHVLSLYLGEVSEAPTYEAGLYLVEAQGQEYLATFVPGGRAMPLQVKSDRFGLVTLGYRLYCWFCQDGNVGMAPERIVRRVPPYFRPYMTEWC